jgi:Asp-tRNA(Asn)/Glu-tRNA(Gln) amidotransferase A subunit family amidase
VELHGAAGGVVPVERAPDGLPLSVQLIGFAWLEEWLFPAALLGEKIIRFDIGEPPLRRAAERG